MDVAAALLLDQIKQDIAHTSDRMHRDARRQHTLKAASLQLGTGKSADEVQAWLDQQHVTLRPNTKQAVAELARKIAALRPDYDQYGRD